MPLYLKYKRGYRILLFFFSLLVFSLIIYSYFSVQSELSEIRKAVSALNTGITTILTSVKNLSSIFFTETFWLVILFAVAIMSINYLLNWYYIEKRNALIDELTELYNRKAMKSWLHKEVGRAQRFKHPLSIAIMDLDRFKLYNDANGHLRGDWLLKHIAKILKENSREIDFVGRYGGEEFVIIFPETGHNNALKVCERIRQTIETTPFAGEENLPTKKVTISIGLVTVCDSFDQEKMLKQADDFLYKAKEEGRNRIVHKNVCP